MLKTQKEESSEKDFETTVHNLIITEIISGQFKSSTQSVIK